MSEGGVLAQVGMTGYVLAAYALTWTVLAGYALYLRARTRRAAMALEAERAVEEERR